MLPHLDFPSSAHIFHPTFKICTTWIVRHPCKRVPSSLLIPYSCLCILASPGLLSDSSNFSEISFDLSLPPSRSTRSVTRAAQARSRALKVYGSSFVSALFPCVFFGDACSCAPRNDRGDFYQVFLGRELLCPFSILHGARFHPWLGRSFPSVQFERYFSNTLDFGSRMIKEKRCHPLDLDSLNFYARLRSIGVPSSFSSSSPPPPPPPSPLPPPNNNRF